MSQEKFYHSNQIMCIDSNNNLFIPRMDTTTKSLKVISTDDSAVHEGKTFISTVFFDDVADSASVNFAFKTPTVASGKQVYLKSMNIFTSGTKVRTDLYETTLDQVAGNDMPVFNKNRNSEVDTAMQSVKSGVTFDATDASMLEYELIGAGSKIELDRFVLKPNTTYVKLFTNLSGSAANISLKIEWIEE
jgi:hypothetical protein